MVELFCSLLSSFSSSLQNSEGDKRSLATFLYNGRSISVSLLRILQLLYHRIAFIRHGYPVTDLSHRSVSLAIVPKCFISTSQGIFLNGTKLGNIVNIWEKKAMLQGQAANVKDWNNRNRMTVTTLNYTIVSLGTNKNFCFRGEFVNWKQCIKSNPQWKLFIKEKGTHFSLERIIYMKKQLVDLYFLLTGSN